MLIPVLSRYDFARGEYGRTISYGIYDESLSAFSLTGYTVYMELRDYDNTVTVVEITTTPDADQVTNKGKGTFSFTSTKHNTSEGLHWVRFRLEKSGEVTYTRPVKVIYDGQRSDVWVPMGLG